MHSEIFKMVFRNLLFNIIFIQNGDSVVRFASSFECMPSLYFFVLFQVIVFAEDEQFKKLLLPLQNAARKFKSKVLPLTRYRTHQSRYDNY